MKKYYLILLFYFLIPPSYSAWNKECLDDCFSTGHECNYCDYQCEVPDKEIQEPLQTNTYHCPFIGDGTAY